VSHGNFGAFMSALGQKRTFQTRLLPELEARYDIDIDPRH
jgi:hypothetical protein